MEWEPPVVRWENSLYFIIPMNNLLPMSEEIGMLSVQSLRKLGILMGQLCRKAESSLPISSLNKTFPFSSCSSCAPCGSGNGTGREEKLLSEPQGC